MDARSSLKTLLIGLVWLASAAAGHAGGLSVSPVRLDFSANRGIAVITLANTSRETLTIESEVVAWPADAAGQTAKDLVVNPPITTIAPGERVRVRVGLVRRLHTDVERGYRIYFTELPMPRSPDSLGIGLRLRLGIPVFVAAGSAQPRPLEWSVGRDTEGLFLAASNPGNVHDKVLKLTAERGGATYSAAQTSPYVMPGSTTLFRMPGLTAGAGETLTLRVQAGDAMQRVEVRVP